MTTLEKPKTVTLDLTADEATELVDYVLWSEYLSASDDLQSAAEACSVTTFGQVVEARDALDAVERRAEGLGWDGQGPVPSPVTVTEDPTWLCGIAVGAFDRWSDHVRAFGPRKQGTDNLAEAAEAIDRLAALRRVLEKLLAAGVPAPRGDGMRLVEPDGPDLERVRAEAFIEIAEVMGRRGAELTRLRHPDGNDLVHWAARFRLHGSAKLGTRRLGSVA